MLERIEFKNNTEAPYVSIIVPMYNLEQYIGECLVSIANQTEESWEALLIDDGSTDKTASICESFCAEDKRFKLLKKENGGSSSAKNHGLRHAVGQFVMFADGDDWLAPNCVQVLLENAIETNADVVIGEYVKVNLEANEKQRVRIKDTSNISYQEAITNGKSGCSGYTWNKLFRKSVIKHYFREDLHYYENLLFCLDNSLSNTFYSIVNEPIYYYRIRSNSTMHTKEYNEKMLTTFEALKLVMNVIPNRCIDNYKYVWINRVCWISNIAKNSNVSVDLSEEKSIAREYLPNVLQSKNLELSTKIKALIVYYAPRLYWIYYINK